MRGRGGDPSSAGQAVLPLAHRHLGGEGKPVLVVLHGLLGSSRNWVGSGRRLAAHFEVYALDLRNHGASPHSSCCGFAEMASDVLAWLDDRGLERVHLMGHSLGGKVAMRLACRQPRRCGLLWVLDIAPKEYTVDATLFAAMRGLDLSRLGSRSDAQAALEGPIPDPATRLFVLTNLVRSAAGGFAWQVNVEGLAHGLDELGEAPLAPGDRFDRPAHFVVGASSPYVTPADEAGIRHHFPGAEIEVLEASGHNVHTERPEHFAESVAAFARRHLGEPS